jgi:hypothetical protein
MVFTMRKKDVAAFIAESPWRTHFNSVLSVGNRSRLLDHFVSIRPNRPQRHRLSIRFRAFPIGAGPRYFLDPTFRFLYNPAIFVSVQKQAISFKVKEGEDFKHRNTLKDFNIKI